MSFFRHCNQPPGAAPGFPHKHLTLETLLDSIRIPQDLRKLKVQQLQQVADQLGFSDASTFGKFFRRHTGKTPTEYRNENSIPLIIE